MRQPVLALMSLTLLLLLCAVTDRLRSAFISAAAMQRDAASDADGGDGRERSIPMPKANADISAHCWW